MNNCANGNTPWGTYLTCEENFNGYFGASTAREGFEPSEELARYGFGGTGFGYGWEAFDPRFDLENGDYAGEPNRFGWVVEVVPDDPSIPPTKRTALGRFKHESAEFVTAGDGRAVVYMGDDERFDYIYKYVSARPWEEMVDEGVSPLDEGTLHVARFDDDATGEWLVLDPSNPALADQPIDQILTFARIAADTVGATPMDRPEWISVGPDGRLYCTLTNNSLRGSDDLPGATPSNPQAPNPNGHIISWQDADDHTGTTFEWDIFVIADDVTDADGQMFGSPDGLWVDPDGRVFVATDGSQPGDNNDQLLVGDATTGEFRRLFTGVPGCEVTGIAVTPDRSTMFVNLQHPGNGDAAVTNFPDQPTGAGGPVPRDATIVITRTDGGVIGS